jgi:hypothetical protein
MEHANALANANKKGISNVVAKTMVAAAAIDAGKMNTAICFRSKQRTTNVDELKQACSGKSVEKNCCMKKGIHSLEGSSGILMDLGVLDGNGDKNLATLSACCTHPIYGVL